MIILDWDDTLLPTTQLTDHYGDFITGGAALPPEVKEQLAVLQDRAIKFLGECTAIGHVTVLTNAMNGAVEIDISKHVSQISAVSAAFGS